MAVDSTLPVALWVVPVPEFGGVARHVYDAAAAGLPGYRMVVLVPAGALADRLTDTGAQVITGSFGTGAGFASSCLSLNRTIGKLGPAVVHSHLAYADVVAACVVVLRRCLHRVRQSVQVPLLVTTEHGISGQAAVYHGSRLKARGREILHRMRLKATDRVIAVSRSTAEQMRRRWGATGVTVVLNGVDTVATTGAELKGVADRQKTAPRLLSLARLAPEKGIGLLLESFARLRESYPQAELEIAGEGELRSRLEQQAVSLGVGGSVWFSGFVNPAEAMARNDIVVQLSQWENLSYTLLDAKVAGLRVVASDVGGNREILSAHELVEAPACNPEAIAQHMSRVWQEAVHPGIAPHSIERMVNDIVACYQKKEPSYG